MMSTTGILNESDGTVDSNPAVFSASYWGEACAEYVESISALSKADWAMIDDSVAEFTKKRGKLASSAPNDSVDTPHLRRRAPIRNTVPVPK